MVRAQESYIVGSDTYMYNAFCFTTKATGELAMDKSQAIQILRDILIDKRSSTVLKALYLRESYELTQKTADRLMVGKWQGESHKRESASAKSISSQNGLHFFTYKRLHNGAVEDSDARSLGYHFSELILNLYFKFIKVPPQVSM
ncbi:hypothetical protein BGAL_0586g00030 [Botrytis galanthina]|uniref:Uncharacterized protein n=1 Tax=Botrytis galanthina TaxID=278940 RepID=A0A4S8QMH5_9HELO|nr:hypothetical protein BGAL_0586g00030 [Botrytis galanthina]